MDSTPSEFPGPVAEEWNLGVECLERGEAQRAVEIFEGWTKKEPSSAEAHSNLALAYKHLGQLERAAKVFDRTLQLDADLPHCQLNAAGVYLRIGRSQDALEAFLRAIELKNDWPPALLGAARTQVILGDLEEGQRLFTKSLAPLGETAKETIDAYRDWASFLHSNSQPEAACEACEQVLKRNRACRDTHFLLGCILLQLGQFRRGWEEFEWRFGTGKPARRSNRDQPVWAGEPLDGQGLLVCYEQGAGDMIQFSRLASELASRGERVFLEATSNLYELFHTLPGIEGIVRPQEPCEEAIWQVPMASLPRVLGYEPLQHTPQIPYLSPPPDPRPDLEVFLAPYKERFKVGVVWTGNLEQPANPIRSCRPDDFSPLATIDGVQLFSLQYEHDVPQEHLEGLGLISLQPVLGDFAHTAAVVKRLDLVITIDTSMSHLAGALGHPVWVLLPEPVCDWRWFLKRKDSPFYPTARLFRQNEPGNWDGVLREVGVELERLVGSAKE